MSYEIYKSIKQHKDNTFTIVSASSNVYDMYNHRSFDTHEVTYFKDNWPNATNAEARAIWALMSVWNGDKFYPSNWKKEQRLASKFVSINGISYEKFNRSNTGYVLDVAKQFIEYKNSLNASKNIKYYLVIISNQYVERRSKSKCYLGINKDNAKLFKGDLNDLKDKFAGYNKYGVTFQEVTKDKTLV